MLIGMLGLGISVAQSQTLENSWENSLEGWTINEPGNWTSTGFSTATGVTAGTYSWNLTAASNPDYGLALTGPSSTALTASLANAGSVSIDVITPVGGSFGYYLQFDLEVNQPGGAGTISLDGYTYNQSPVIGGGESTLTWAVPASVRQALAGHPSLPTYFTFQIGGGGGGTMYLDYLRVNPLGQINSWEVSTEGWTINEPGIWTNSALSTTTGVTAGLYSWQLTAGSSPDYGTAFTGPSSTALTATLANSASVSVDLDVPNANDFGQYHYMQWDLVINQPGGLGTVSVTTNNYTGNANVGGQTTMTWPIPQWIRTTLLNNSTLPSSLSLEPGSCCPGGTSPSGGGVIYLDNLRANLLPPAQANLWVRELWDDIGGEEIPANAAVTDNSSSVGFTADPWAVNPAEVNNCSLMAFRPGFNNEPEVGSALAMGLPGSLDGFYGCMVQENNTFGFFGGNSYWSDGIFMTRPLTADNYINFQATGEYWFSMIIANGTGSLDAQYVTFPASGWGGFGFSDGSTTNADFVAIGVTGLNVWLGPTNTSAFHGDTNVSKALYISQGTLGQPGDPTTLIYNPLNDPNASPAEPTSGFPTNYYSQTNFSGGPYHINAYGAQTVGILNGDNIVLLGHLKTYGNGTATLDAKYYNYNGLNSWNYDMDTSPSNITWDCSYSFNFGGTMTTLLLFQNGQFPFYVFGIRASTNFVDVVGLDPGRMAVAPLANTYIGYPINLTNLAVEANIASFVTPPALYGTLNYQWYQNGLLISGATSQYFNIASASTNDPSMPAGTDAGTYSSVATDPSGTWGSVTNSVVITVTQLNPPIMTGVQLFQGQNSFLVTFNEPNCSGAANTNSYVFNDGIVATGVNVFNTPTVTEAQVLTTPLPVGTRITLTVSGVTNVVGGVLPTTNITFWTDLIQTGVADWDAWLIPQSEINFNYFNTWVPANPTPVILTNQVLTSWEGPINTGVNLNGGNGVGSDWGDRLYGWFIPPVTTNYVFFCCSDDGSRLSLSTNDASTNLFVIATESNWSPQDEWTNINDYGGSPQLGDGTANGAGPTINGNPYVWDNSVAGQSPATACIQNRSDQFIVAYYDSTGATGGPPQATNSWLTAAPPVDNCVPLGTTNFWPFRDTNGQALITLHAGQRYFMMLEHAQNTGGYDEDVTYKIASEPDPYSPTNSLLTGSVIAGFVPFAPTISITNTPAGPQINYTGVLLAGSSLSTITNQVAISSNGTSVYIPPNLNTNMFYRTSE